METVPEESVTDSPLTNSPQALRMRTKQFALRVIKLFRALPKSEEARIIGRQVMRAGTSVAANYRACNRARSRAEFIAKLGVVIEEADETLFWLELLGDSGIIPPAKLEALERETNELLAIFYSAKRTALRNSPSKQR